MVRQQQQTEFAPKGTAVRSSSPPRSKSPPRKRRRPEDTAPFATRLLPLGNLATSAAAHQARRRRALGLLHAFSDADLCALLDVLTRTLAPRGAAALLARLSALSTHLHALASDDDLWRRLSFALFSPSQLANAPFRHSWRATLARLLAPTAAPPTNDGTTTTSAAAEGSPARAAASPVVHSDVLFHKRRCLEAEIDPAWLAHHDVPRRAAADLPAAAFRAEFEAPRRPVILTGLATSWRAAAWTPTTLAELCGGAQFNAGGHLFCLRDYFRYAAATAGRDDQPLYVFDSAFAEKAPALAAAYDAPPHFGPDLFALLGDARRPAFRWLIAGPPRSGSSFHVDPNATSAWNAALCGRKKWLLFPPGAPPPGVRPSRDGADVAAPVSVLEWFVNFYDRAAIRAAGAVECVVQPGEIIFVPRGWWHCVINLDTSIAITQNYCGEHNVDAVVRWLRTRPHQISGCRSQADANFMRDRFAALVVDKYPHLRDRLRFALDSGDGDGSDTGAESTRATRSRADAGLWDRLRTDKERAAQGDDEAQQVASAPFTFAFS